MISKEIIECVWFPWFRDERSERTEMSIEAEVKRILWPHASDLAPTFFIVLNRYSAQAHKGRCDSYYEAELISCENQKLNCCGIVVL